MSAISSKERCAHEKIELRRKICTNGSPMWGHQCTECGRLIGDWVKSTDPAVVKGGPSIPDWDDLRSEQYWAERRARGRFSDKHGDNHQARLEDERRQWWRDYSEYLKSPEWKSKRARVMRRASGYCEGCLIEYATEVHHLTYKHVKNEFCFELVALCHFCHERVHGEHENMQLSQLGFMRPRIAVGS